MTVSIPASQDLVQCLIKMLPLMMKVLVRKCQRAIEIGGAGPNNTSNIILKNVTLNYVSMNHRYFKLRVSWSLT